jgi:hypothetical protein
MTLNAALATTPRKSSHQVITEQSLINTIDINHWKQRLSKAGHRGLHGVSLAEFEPIVKRAFTSCGFPEAQVDMVQFDEPNAESMRKLKEILEKLSQKYFIILNFDQAYFTDDEHAGHYSPIGAYDKNADQVLILDTDRKYFEPYWVSTATVLQAISTKDSRGTARGLVSVRFTY